MTTLSGASRTLNNTSCVQIFDSNVALLVHLCLISSHVGKLHLHFVDFVDSCGPEIACTDCVIWTFGRSNKIAKIFADGGIQMVAYNTLLMLSFSMLTIYICCLCKQLSVNTLIKSNTPCGLRGCKNRPALFPGRMSYKATKPGLVSVLYLSTRSTVLFITAPF